MSDTNYGPGDFSDRSGEPIGPLLLNPPAGGAGFDDIFKTSHCTDCVFEDVTVEAGHQRENAWDANRFTKGNVFRRLKLDAGAQPAVYLKCGFSNNIVDDVEITKSGGHSDWYEGDYSDAGGEKNRGNHYSNVRRKDGKPLRVAWTFFRAEKPVFHNSGPVRYQYLWSLIRTLYTELKYLFPKLIP